MKHSPGDLITYELARDYLCFIIAYCVQSNKYYSIEIINGTSSNWTHIDWHGAQFYDLVALKLE